MSPYKWLKTIFIAPDFIISLLISLGFYFSFSNSIINNVFVKDIYNIGISVMSIIFSIYFASFSFIISSSNDDFVRFLINKDRYKDIITLFKISLYIIFISLVFSIFSYINTAFLINESFSGQHKYYFSLFCFFFSWGLGTSLSISLETLKYAITRVNFIKKLDEINKQNQQESDQHKE